MSNFRQVDRETGYLLPPSVDDWLPERHLARFVVEVIEQLDLSPFVKAYRGSGSAAHHPSVLLGLLIYGYATGVYSSRKLERATYDSVAFRFIAANDHPDPDGKAVPLPHLVIRKIYTTTCIRQARKISATRIRVVTDSGNPAHFVGKN